MLDGYELLGLIIEKATGTTYEETLHQKIFEPLEMEYSHLMFYSRPAMESPWPMCDLYYKDINLARTNSARFGPGIDYGFGLMRFRFIGAPKKYMIWGNSGSIGTYMYYNPRLDTFFIGTFNHVNYRHQPIIFLFKIMRIMFKTDKNQRH